MSFHPKTVIVTGASQGIGAAVAHQFVTLGYNVVGTSRDATRSKWLKAGEHLALIDGDIGDREDARKVAQFAVERFGSIDAVVANAGIFSMKSFHDFTAEDFRALVSTNLEGFIYISQFAVRQMLEQKTGGSIVSITSSLVKNPQAGVHASLPMITKGGLEAAIRNLAVEYARDRIRFNVVAPGVVDTPMHHDDSKDFLRTLSPMGAIASVDEIASAVVYLTEAPNITGEVLHVDGGAHNGRW